MDPKTRSIDSADGGVRSLSRALAILLIVAREGGTRGMGLLEVSRRCGLHKSTTYRLIGVLLKEGFLVRDSETERYRLGLAVLELGSAFLGNLTLRQEALPLLEKLMRDTDETVHLGVREAYRSVYIEKIQAPENVIVHTQIGQGESIHLTALGKAILAFSTPAEIEDVIARGLEAKTKYTVTDPDAFRAMLAKVRTVGYAVNLQENREHINGVGAPIFDHLGMPVAGISVSGLAQRLPEARLHEIGALTKAAAAEISRRMGHVRKA